MRKLVRALIADIHGNHLALRAVLDDIRISDILDTARLPEHGHNI